MQSKNFKKDLLGECLCCRVANISSRHTKGPFALVGKIVIRAMEGDEWIVAHTYTSKERVEVSIEVCTAQIGAEDSSIHLLTYP